MKPKNKVELYVTLFLFSFLTIISCRKTFNKQVPPPVDAAGDTAHTEDSVRPDTIVFFPGSDDDEGIVYSSERINEKLFHVRVSVSGTEPLFVFLGACEPLDSLDTLAKIRVYEYSRAGGLTIADSFPMKAFDEEWIVSKDGVYFESMVFKQFDNLALHDGYLYYYREHGRLNGNGMYSREYFRYALGSGKHPEMVGPEEFYAINDRVMVGPNDGYCLSPSLSAAAFTNVYDIQFYHIGEDGLDGFKNFFDTRKPFTQPELINDRGDFSLLQYFPGSPQLELPCDYDALFGGMAWHPSEEFLFFDNSGYCYASIWLCDLRTHKVKKIIPEHEAIHPQYFTIGGQEYLAYVYGGQVRWMRLDLKALMGRNPGEQMPESLLDATVPVDSASRSKDLFIFLQAYRNHIVAHNRDVIVRDFLNPEYVRMQIEDFYQGRVEQHFSENFNYQGQTFDDITGFDIDLFDITFGDDEEEVCGTAIADVTVSYVNGGTVRREVIILKCEGEERLYRVEAPRG